MKKYLLNCAGITFVITVEPAIEQQFRGYQLVSADDDDIDGVKIQVDFNPEDNQTVDLEELRRPADVTLKDTILSIKHSAYTCTYDLISKQGRAVLSSYYGLLSVIRIIFTVILVDADGFAIHSSCILRNGQTHIFSGHSGAGKSTIIKLTDQPILYSDELTVVRKDENGIFNIHHSPFRSEFFTNPEPPTQNIAGIYFLKQDTEVYVKYLSRPEALFRLFPNIFFPVCGRHMYEAKTINLCLDFLQQVQPYELHFKKDKTFWRCIDEEFHVGSKSSSDNQKY